MKRILYTDTLIHYGVLGMKWGVKKDRTTFASQIGRKVRRSGNRALNRARNLTGSRSSKALKAARKMNIDNMSDQELSKVINRLNLERNYRSLTRLDLNKGQRIAKDYLKYDSTYNAILNSNTYMKVAKAAGI